MTAEPKIREARAVAARLEAAGNVFDANIIRRLCLSNMALRETASRLSKDNSALRETAK